MLDRCPNCIAEVPEEEDHCPKCFWDFNQHKCIPPAGAGGEGSKDPGAPPPFLEELEPPRQGSHPPSVPRTPPEVTGKPLDEPPVKPRAVEPPKLTAAPKPVKEPPKKSPVKPKAVEPPKAPAAPKKAASEAKPPEKPKPKKKKSEKPVPKWLEIHNRIKARDADVEESVLRQRRLDKTAGIQEIHTEGDTTTD